MSKATVIFDDSKKGCKDVHGRIKDMLKGYSPENAQRMQRLGVTCTYCNKTFHSPDSVH